MPVDMRAKPYYLDDEAVQWVEDTIASMSLEEKIGQLFFNMGSSRTEEYLKMTVDKYHIGVSATTPAPRPRCMSRTVFCRKIPKFLSSSPAIPRTAATVRAATAQ